MDNIDQINESLSEDLNRHYIKRDKAQLVNLERISEYKKQKEDSKDKDIKTHSFKDRLINSLLIRTGILLLIFGIICVYPYFPEDIKSCKAIEWIKNEYNKEYTREEVMNNVEKYSKIIYSKVNKYLPEDFNSKFTNIYTNNIKPFFIEDRLEIQNTVSVFNNEDLNIEMDNSEYILAQSVATSSEISQMDIDIQEILSKNIEIHCPVKGTVTSEYGAREEVFKNVGYHTGVDIANVLNTPVASATNGVVVRTQAMDKYYGNNIEIECNGVIFKYAHLNQINVNKGDNVLIGDIIGLMGSTGASTGSHLHFEIKFNGRTVDPELLVDVR